MIYSVCPNELVGKQIREGKKEKWATKASLRNRDISVTAKIDLIHTRQGQVM
jgi:hypothetical protein